MNEVNRLKQRSAEIIEKIQMKRVDAMGQATSDEMRQIIGLMYDQFMQDFYLLDAVECKCEQHFHLNENQSFFQKLINSFITTGILLAFAIVLSYFDKYQWIGLIFVGLAAVQLIIKFAKQWIISSVEKGFKTYVTIDLNEESKQRIVEKRLQDLTYIEPEIERMLNSSHYTMADVGSIANLYTELYTMEKLEDATQIPYCLHIAGQLLAQNKLNVVEYGENSAGFFDEVPSDMVDLTVKPAICADGVLVKKGLHYFKIDE